MTASERSERLIAPSDARGPDSRAASEARDLDAVYRDHAAEVSRWIRRLAPREDAADLVHEVFLVVERRLPEFRGDSRLSTWLYAITLRVAWSARRKRKLRRLFFVDRERDEPALEAEDLRTPHAAVESLRAAERVNRTLEALSERDRALLVLFELEGFGASEISEILSLSENGVWVAIHRARARFRAAYERIFGQGGSEP